MRVGQCSLKLLNDVFDRQSEEYLEMKLLLLFVFTIAVTSISAQTSAVQEVARHASEQRLRHNLYALASDSMAGRLMGSHGDTMAARYVADAFRKADVTAPYQHGHSYLQSIEATRYVDRSSLDFAGRSYAEFEGWRLFPSDTFKVTNCPVVVSGLISIEDWDKHLDEWPLAGSAVFIDGSLFKDLDRLDSLEKVFASKGVRLVIWTNTRVAAQAQRKNFLPVYKVPDEYNTKTPVHELRVSPQLLQQLLEPDQLSWQDSSGFSLPAGERFSRLSTTISLSRERQEIEVRAPNVIGVIKGTDPDAGAVILSAHHDHDGRNGQVIYYGAVDNASGTVSIMEIAELFHQAKLKGLRPKRTIIIGSWTGEERGLQGSFYYRDHPVVPLSRTFAVLNMDMLGRIDTLHLKAAVPNSNYAYILVKDDTVQHRLRKALFDANKSIGLTLDTYYEQPKYMQRRLLGSDQYAFYQKGIPFVRIDCGFAKEYHQPEDTPDKIDYPLLTKQTQLAFLTLWNMANL